MARRGFFAELQHQNQQAKRRKAREQNERHRAYVAAVRQSEQRQRDSERAQAQLAKATAAERRELERIAKLAHEEAMQAEVDEQNAALSSQYEELDGILNATLGVDDFVDLEALRRIPEHPPFPRPDLHRPLSKPEPIEEPTEPTYVEPEAPRGIGHLLRRKKHADVISESKIEFQKLYDDWRQRIDELPIERQRQEEAYQAVEHARVSQLSEVQRSYDAECQTRQAEADEANASLDTFIQSLEYDVEEAVQEYIAMVLGNSVYPDFLPVDYDFTFNSKLRELTLTVLVPAASALPTVKEYKYVRAKNEIVPSGLTLKALKDRYTSVVCQIALRTLHEIFEADRAGRIQTIALKVAVEGLNPATGLSTRTDLLAVSTDRSFLSYDLANVVPTATLQYLGALVSKSPYDLVPIDESKGVRGRR